MKRVEVVAAVIFNAARTEVLVALRKPSQHQGDRWEFPGGKLESGESIESGLARELVEEIGIDVISSCARTTIEHNYPDKHVCLHFWDVTHFSGVPIGREGQQLRWVAVTDLNKLRFPEANQAIVDALLTESA
ncbi:8-oxo-dGTP diphosphatase MutT [Granulosicoccus sp.]|jgi:8-oxo-dGTP diphosphatase|nr:8-oxo-dGTP diphosphatase MutT [Granulosicoccus sp.]MDB4222828.1 8-oxo-dGTP diphosphatase MutT [Granulosicoccus sp.]